MKKSLTILFMLMIIITVPSLAWTRSTLNDPFTNPNSISFYIVDASYQGDITTSVTSWNTCPEVNLYQTYSSIGANIKLYVNTFDNGTYAVASQVSADNKHINYYKTWIDTTTSRRRETTAHEVGHSLGLGHCQGQYVAISVMRETGWNGTNYPLSDDKTGISYIY